VFGSTASVPKYAQVQPWRTGFQFARTYLIEPPITKGPPTQPKNSDRVIPELSAGTAGESRRNFLKAGGIAALGLAAGASIPLAGSADMSSAAEEVPSSFIVLRGEGIDPTGSTLSTVAVQALIDSMSVGGVRLVQVAAGDILNLEATIRLSSNTRLIGPGELRWTNGIAAAAALSIVGDNVSVEGVTLSDFDGRSSATGNRNIGVLIAGNDVTIQRNTIVGFQNGVVVSARGEFFNHIITNNRIKDLTGVGGGPA
jgi:hypothetical protein